MKSYKLIIDTAAVHGMSVELRCGEQSVAHVRANQKPRQLVNAVEKVLQEAGIGKDAISGISVHTGPGSFTGLRSGITVARMLGLILSVPVNDRDAMDPIEPEYGKSKFDES